MPEVLVPAGPVDDVRRAVTEEATRRIAARIICDPEFPAEHLLPRLAPIPHGNLGQQILLDYALLARLVWGAERQVRAKVAADRSGAVGATLAFCAALGGVALGFVAFQARPAAPGIGLLLVVAGVVSGLAIWALTRPDLNRLIATARAEYLEELLAGGTPAAAAAFEKSLKARTLAEWGDGSMDGGAAPVLVMRTSAEPFPGYGRHQARELFVCRPSADKPPTEHDAAKLSAEVSRALVAMVRVTGIACVSSGRVVLLDGDTLHNGSAWLASATGGTSGPRLWLPNERLDAIADIDPRAAARVYTCIQAIVPEYTMCLTFFVRTFLAGNSAACEVNVCTLGPPETGWYYVRDKLRVHRRESSAGEPGREDERPAHMTALGWRLESVRYAVENSGVRFRKAEPRAELPKLDPFDAAALAHEAAQVRAITRNSDLWPGMYTETTNWRQAYSLTFTPDFFGSTESQAILRTLFDRIGRQALSTLKEQGYDVSDYQDESGQFHINADKIEQLVVGEKVYVDPKKRKKDKSGEGATAAAATGQTGGGGVE